jgi:hypothetical protein
MKGQTQAARRPLVRTRHCQSSGRRRDLSPRAWGAAADTHEQRSLRAHISRPFGECPPWVCPLYFRVRASTVPCPLELPAVATSEVLAMYPCTSGTEGPAADCGPALRIPQDSVARLRIDPVDALTGGTVRLALHAIEAYSTYANTAESVFACCPRGASDGASERLWSIGSCLA